MQVASPAQPWTIIRPDKDWAKKTVELWSCPLQTILDNQEWSVHGALNKQQNSTSITDEYS